MSLRWQSRFLPISHMEILFNEGDVQADSACSQDAVNPSLLLVIKFRGSSIYVIAPYIPLRLSNGASV